jgi:hypothetical protein
VAANAFSKAALLIFQESVPLPKVLGTVLAAMIKNSAIGVAAFAKGLEDDWKMVKPYCGAHCKTCTSNGFAEYFDALGVILAVANPNAASTDASNSQQACTAAATALRSFVTQVATSGSFQNTQGFWHDFAVALDKLAVRMPNVLVAGAP